TRSRFEGLHRKDFLKTPRRPVCGNRANRAGSLSEDPAEMRGLLYTLADASPIVFNQGRRTVRRGIDLREAGEGKSRCEESRIRAISGKDSKGRRKQRGNFPVDRKSVVEGKGGGRR